VAAPKVSFHLHSIKVLGAALGCGHLWQGSSWGPGSCSYVLTAKFGSHGPTLTASEEGEPSDVTHPARVILPLTPNPGLIGDGRLCLELKISHEVHLNSPSSESRSEQYLVAEVIR
jgi:hypothetical protein